MTDHNALRFHYRRTAQRLARERKIAEGFRLALIFTILAAIFAACFIR